MDLLAFVDEPFAVDPLLEARNVDHAHGASAFARTYELIRLTILCGCAFLLGAEADSADSALPGRCIGAAHDAGPLLEVIAIVFTVALFSIMTSK